MDFLFLLLLANPLNSLMDHPLRDLASLVEPAAVLQKMNVQTDEATLIGLLDAGAGDTAYVKKLMAIRLLEKTQALYALPALEQAAKDPDVTLSEAAREAFAAIRGDPSPRPNGAALLKELARSLPSDIGFVAVLDFERDAKPMSFHAFVENALKEITDKGLVSPPIPRKDVAENADEFDEMILAALSEIGNVRLDAAVLASSSDFGVEPNKGYIALICKGLYGPERVGRLLDSARFKQREVAGRRVYVGENNSPQICLLDAHTFVAALTADPSSMGKLLGALTAAEKKPPQKTLAAAFDLVTEKKMRLAFSGSFSPAQKVLLRAAAPGASSETGEDEMNLAAVFARMLPDLAQADAFTGEFDVRGNFAFQVTCPDAAAAAKLGESAAKFEQAFRKIVTALVEAPTPLIAHADRLKNSGSVWKTEVAEKTVSMAGNDLMPLLVGAAAPLYWANAQAEIMSEGVVIAGTVRTALRIYAAQHGGSYAGATMKNIQIGDTDLEGKYFAQSDCSLTNVTATTYFIKVGPPSKAGKRKMPYYTIDQLGSEYGTYYTSQ